MYIYQLCRTVLDDSWWKANLVSIQTKSISSFHFVMTKWFVYFVPLDKWTNSKAAFASCLNGSASFYLFLILGTVWYNRINCNILVAVSLFVLELLIKAFTQKRLLKVYLPKTSPKSCIFIKCLRAIRSWGLFKVIVTLFIQIWWLNTSGSVLIEDKSAPKFFLTNNQCSETIRIWNELINAKLYASCTLFQ